MEKRNWKNSKIEKIRWTRNQKTILTTSIYNELKQEIDFEKSELEEYKQKRFDPEGDWLIQEKILIQLFKWGTLTVQKIADKNKFDFNTDKSSAIIILCWKKNTILASWFKSILRRKNWKSSMNFDDESKEKEEIQY